MSEKKVNPFIEKLHGRDMVNSHAISKKVNEIIDTINEAVLREEQEKKGSKNNVDQTLDNIEKSIQGVGV